MNVLAKSEKSPANESKAATPALLTIGHSIRPWKDFLVLLRAHGVKRLLDVRTIPRSRRNPQFNRDTLAKKLRDAKIAYTHLPKLGGLRRPQPDSPNMAWRNTSFRGYADHMRTPEFAAGLQRLLKLAAHKRCAIMCAEAVPWRCHRSLIADALTARAVPVAHIMSPARAQPHKLTPFAVVRRRRVTYPLPQAARPAPPRSAKSKKKGKSKQREFAETRANKNRIT